MNKKISAMMLVLVFLVGLIPAVFAQQDNASGQDIVVSQNRQGISVENGEQVRANAAVDPVLIKQRARINERARENVESGQVKRVELAKVVREKISNQEQRLRQRISNQEMLRTIAKEKIQQTREQYARLKVRYSEVKANYAQNKQQFNGVREQLKNCAEEETSDCSQLVDQAKKQVKPYLADTADLVLTELEKLKARIESSEELSEEQAQEMLDDVNSKIQEIQDAKELIDGLSEDATRQEINQAAKTIRDAWKNTKLVLKKHAGRLANAKLGNIVFRVEILEKKLYNTRDRLELQGKDVSAIDSALLMFSEKLDDSADKYNEARSLWSDANTPEEVDAVAKQVHEILTEAKDSLKEAKELLRKVVLEIKQVNGGVLAFEEDSDSETIDSDDVELSEEGDVQTEGETDDEGEANNESQ